MALHVDITELLRHHLELLKHVFYCEEQKYGPGCVDSIHGNLADLLMRLIPPKKPTAPSEF